MDALGQVPPGPAAAPAASAPGSGTSTAATASAVAGPDVALQWCRCCGERRPGCVLLPDAFRPEPFDKSFVHCDHICPLCHRFVGNLMQKIFTKSTHDKVLRYWLAEEPISLPKHHVFIRDRIQATMHTTRSEHVRKAQGFVPYVPGLVVEYLCERWSGSSRDPKDWNSDINDTVDAIILMADVTGYTALAETFCEQRGVNAGVEAVVTNCLNKYFTKLVETIYDYGGDVVKFAGDAVLCIWRPQAPAARRLATPQAKQQKQQILESYAQAAMLCAFKCKGLVERVQVGTDEKVLKLHCGLACGKISILSVGGENKREVLLTGNSLRRAGDAVAFAAAESVVICHSVWRHVRTITICSPVVTSASNAKVTKFFGEEAPILPFQALSGDEAAGGSPSRALRGPCTSAPMPVTRADAESPPPVTAPHTGRALLSARDSAPSCPTDGPAPAIALAKLRPIVTDLTTNGKASLGDATLDQDAMLRGRSHSPGTAPRTTPRIPSNGFWLVKNITVCPVLDKSFNQSEVDAESAVSLPDELLLKTLESYIPAHVAKQMKSRQRIYNDVRLVSTLFLNISNEEKTIGYETDPGQLALLRDIFALAQRIVSHYEGMIRQFIVDDKGCVLIVCFGVSTFRHKDDASRAIATALDLQRSLTALTDGDDHDHSPIKTSIGITTGRAFCGPIGSRRGEVELDMESDTVLRPERREFSVVGNCVNLAARLMNVAFQRDEGILCDETTAESVRLSIGQHKRGPTFIQVDSVYVKGVKSKVPIFKPSRSGSQRRLETVSPSPPSPALALSPTTGRQTRGADDGFGHGIGQSGSISSPLSTVSTDETVCFGREQEKSFISHRLFAFTKGVLDPCILIQGEEGMGKSNLLEWARHEIRSNAQYASIKVLGGNCNRSGSRIPYYGYNSNHGLYNNNGGPKIAYDGLKGFLCDLFELPLTNHKDDQQVLTDLVQRLQESVASLSMPNIPAPPGNLFLDTAAAVSHSLPPPNAASTMRAAPVSRPPSLDHHHSPPTPERASGRVPSDPRICRAASVARGKAPDLRESISDNHVPLSKPNASRICSVNAAGGFTLGPPDLSMPSQNRATDSSRRRSLPNTSNKNMNLLASPTVEPVSAQGPQSDTASVGADPLPGNSSEPNAAEMASSELKVRQIRNYVSQMSEENAKQASAKNSRLGRLGSIESIVSRGSRGSRGSKTGRTLNRFSSVESLMPSSSSSSSSDESDEEDDTPHFDSDLSPDDDDHAHGGQLASAAQRLGIFVPLAKPPPMVARSNAVAAIAAHHRQQHFHQQSSAGSTGQPHRPAHQVAFPAQQHLAHSPPVAPQPSSANKSKLGRMRGRISRRLSSEGKRRSLSPLPPPPAPAMLDNQREDRSSASSRADEDLDDADEEVDLLELSNQRILNQQVLQFRLSHPLIASKIDETYVRVFLSSKAQDLAKCIVHTLAASNPHKQHESMRVDHGFEDNLASNKALNNTDALIAEVLCLIVMLCLDQRRERVCVTIDDLEWLDDLSMALLRHIVGPQCPGVMVIATIRSSTVDRVQKRLGFKFTGSPFIYPFELGPLNQEEIEHLLTHTFGISSWPSDMLHRVMNSCNGLPLWAIEYVRGMIANKYIKRDEKGEWCFDENTASMEIVFSAGLEGAILQRFDNLKEEVWKQAFTWACVVESDFSVSMIRDLLIFSELQDKLEELVNLRLIKAISGMRSEKDERFYAVCEELSTVQLGEDLKVVLDCAKRAPRHFTLNQLVKVRLQGVDTAKYQAIIDELQRERFVVPSYNTDHDGEQMYRVAHDYYYHAVYNQVPPGEVGRYHLQTAQCLSAHENEYIEPLLAHHYRKAKDERNTMRCFYRAAKSHFRRDYIPQACGFLIEAVCIGDQLLMDSEDFCEMKLMLAEMLLYLGRHTDAVVYLHQVEDMLGFACCPEENDDDFISAPSLSRQQSIGSRQEDQHSRISPSTPSNNSVSSKSSSFSQRLARFGSGSSLPAFSTSGPSRDPPVAGRKLRHFPRRTKAASGGLPMFHSSNNAAEHVYTVNQGSAHLPPNQGLNRVPPPQLVHQHSGLSAASAPPPGPDGLGSRRGSLLTSMLEEAGFSSTKPRSSSLGDTPNRGRGAPDELASTDSVGDGDDCSASSGMFGTMGGALGTVLRHSRVRARPSLRRMCSSSVFNGLPFFNPKSTPEHDLSFLADNLDWTHAHALLISTSFYNMDHDLFVKRIKSFIAVALENGITKESPVIQFAVYFAHCVSAKYAKIKPSFTLTTIEAIAGEVQALRGVDHAFVIGNLYKVCALCSISKAALHEARDFLEKAQLHLRHSPLLKHNMHRKNIAEVLFMQIEVAIQKGNLVQAERLWKDLNENFARVLQSPQVVIWTEAMGVIIRFRRCGILLTLKDIETFEEEAKAEAAAEAAAAAAVAAAVELGTVSQTIPGSAATCPLGRSSSLARMGVNGCFESNSLGHRAPAAALPSMMTRGGSLGAGTPAVSVGVCGPIGHTGDVRDGFESLANMRHSEAPGQLPLGAEEERLMKVDQALLAAMRSWKLGDRNNLSNCRGDATQYATVAWNIVLEHGQQSIVWYLGVVYEMLFYAIIQIVYLRPTSGPNRNTKAPKRFSMSFSSESVKHLCKSFKQFAETFSGFRPVAYRCKGLMYVLRNKPAKAAGCFRKGGKAAIKLEMDYEHRFCSFLLHQYCREYLTRFEAAAVRHSFAGNGVSRAFTAAFDLTLQSWRSGQRSHRSELLRVLTSHNELSPTRRSIPSTGSSGFQIETENAALNANRAKRRSSGSRKNPMVLPPPHTSMAQVHKKSHGGHTSPASPGSRVGGVLSDTTHGHTNRLVNRNCSSLSDSTEITKQRLAVPSRKYNKNRSSSAIATVYHSPAGSESLRRASETGHQFVAEHRASSRLVAGGGSLSDGDESTLVIEPPTTEPFILEGIEASPSPVPEN